MTILGPNETGRVYFVVDAYQFVLRIQLIGLSVLCFGVYCPYANINLLIPYFNQ